MIDADFYPDRLQLRAIGTLLDIAHKHPETPAITEKDLYNRVFERDVEIERPDWMNELQGFGLLVIRRYSSFVGGRLIEQEPRVSITPAGVFYAVSRIGLFVKNARTPTDDFPEEIIETPSAIFNYFSVSREDYVPAADRIVAFDHNSDPFKDAIAAIEGVELALRENELGAAHPEIRDEKLEELRAIRELLAQPEASSGKLQAMAWGVFGFLAAEFATRPIGYAADHAWNMVLNLLGASA